MSGLTESELKKELEKYSLENLRKFCSNSQHLHLYSKLHKDELIEYLIENTYKKPTPPQKTKKDPKPPKNDNKSNNSSKNIGDFRVMSYFFLNKKNILRSLEKLDNDYFEKYSSFSNTREKYRFAKEIFGDVLIPLNKNLTRKLIGKSFYILSGKSWSEELHRNSKKSQKMTYIRQVTIVAEENESFIVKEQRFETPYSTKYMGFTIGSEHNDIFAFAEKI